MGNTVGRMDTTFCNFSNVENAYAFGLWCADGYHRTSSIGLTNTDANLIEKFRMFLLRYFPKERIKMRIYSRDSSFYYLKNAIKPAYQIYVNSRVLLRCFKNAKKNPKLFLNDAKSISAYFAGRFDGDGSINRDLRSDLRIVYGNKEEAEKDSILLKELGITSKIYFYKSARTFVLYILRNESEKFLNMITPFTLKLKHRKK